MPALDEAVIESNQTDRAADRAEYRDLLFRCDAPRPGDVERARTLKRELGVSDENFRQQCATVREYKAAVTTAGDDAPITKAEAAKPELEKRAHSAGVACAEKFLAHVAPESMPILLAALSRCLPRDSNGFAGPEGREAQAVHDEVRGLLYSGRVGVEEARAAKSAAVMRVLELRRLNPWLTEPVTA